MPWDNPQVSLPNIKQTEEIYVSRK